MNFFLLLALVVAAAVAVPVYQTEMSFMPFQKNMDQEMEDRNNPAFVSEIAYYAFMANLILLIYKWQAIICVINFSTCGTTNVNATNFHMYDTLKAPQHILAATDLLMSNLNNAQNVVPSNLKDLISAKSDTPAIDAPAFEQTPFKDTELNVTPGFPPVTQTQITTQHNIEFQGDAIRAQNLVYPSFPVHNIIAPYSKFSWPMYPNYGRILRPHSDFLFFDPS